MFPGGTTGQRQQLAGTINPFLAGAGQALYGRGSPVGIAAGTVGDVGQGLPELQALQLLLSGPRPPTLYQPSPFDQWLGLAGVPLRTLNLPEAQSRAQQGR